MRHLDDVGGAGKTNNDILLRKRELEELDLNLDEKRKQFDMRIKDLDKKSKEQDEINNDIHLRKKELEELDFNLGGKRKELNLKLTRQKKSNTEL